MKLDGQVNDLRAVVRARDGLTGVGSRVKAPARWGLTVLLLAGASWACSKSDESLDDAGTGQTTQQGPQCQYSGLEAAQSSAMLSVRQQILSFNALTTTTPDSPSQPFDEILIYSYQDATHGGPVGPGSYPLYGTSWGNCSLCVVGLRGCRSAGDCDKIFFANRGFVEISSLAGANSTLTGTLHNVELSEVQWDHNGDLVEVDSGELWCTDGWSFSAPVEEHKAKDTCVVEGTGVGLGDNIADYTLTTCTGETFHLHSKCGTAKALWMVAVAGWCPACTEAVPQIVQAYNEYNSQGLDVMFILGEDENYRQPTVEYCQQYAESHHVDPALVYIDYGSQYGSFETTFTNINPYTSQLGLPWSAVLRPSNMEYYYSDSAGGGDLNGALNDLLNQ